ncbi:unnamed protein product [Rotaria socialis]|uniref:Envelope protein n=1 Tax=Rotaria socialis TaxID=392032 RepID=A0A817ZF00_9BILA|nr:unnamed protein product [Rotaria socialis]
MVDVARLFFLYFTINLIRTALLVQTRDWQKNDTIININKGYALRRLGVYSSDVAEEIVHTFIPINNLCVLSPETDVCQYASLPLDTNVAQLATTTIPGNTARTLSPYNTENIPRLIREGVSRVLAQHHPDEIIKNYKSIAHFVDNQFYYHKSDVNAIITTSPTNTLDKDIGISRFRSNSMEIIRKQINNNKIGFEYLSHTDLKLFLTAIFLIIDASYTVSNFQVSLDIFSQLILGQSVFVSRYCSIGQRNLLSPEPCLIISTLFLRTPSDSTSIFSIFRLIPLPIIDNGFMYTYSKLPKIIGVNSIDQTFLMWNEEIDIKECTFSRLVQCRTKPVSTTLLKSSCISQLFDDDELDTSICEVSRTQNIDQDIMRIDDDIWLFSNVRHTEYCQIYSASDELTETILINEASVLRIPCNKTVTCRNSQLPTASCTQHRVTITPAVHLHHRLPARFLVPIKDMSKTIVRSYQLQLNNKINDLMTNFSAKRPKMKQVFEDYLNYIASVIAYILFLIFIYLMYLIKYKQQRALKCIASFVQDTVSA